MHHITKSLFVGAAIVGIGISSGKAELPLSGETRAWNATVKKLEPLYKEKGVKLNADGLRHAITQTVLNRRPRFYEKDMYGKYDSFGSFVLHVKHAMFGLCTDSEQSCKTEIDEAALSETMHLINGQCEKRRDLESTSPKWPFIVLARSIDDIKKWFKTNENLPYRKITFEQAKLIDKHYRVTFVSKMGIGHSLGFEKFTKDEELFMAMSWFYEDDKYREISDKIFSKIDSFIDTVISYRLYYQLTGLYDDTEIEQ